MPRKPTLAEMMVRHHVYTGELSHASQISSLLVNAMYSGRPVAREDAQKILVGLTLWNELHARTNHSDVAGGMNGEDK